MLHVALVALEDQRFTDVAWHDVEVKVLHRLPRRLAVVLQDVEAVARERRLEVRRDLLDAPNDVRQRRVRRIEQPLAVRLGNDERVALAKRVDVEIGQDQLVLVDLEARDFAGGDGAENAVVRHTWFVIRGS